MPKHNTRIALIILAFTILCSMNLTFFKSIPLERKSHLSFLTKFTFASEFELKNYPVKINIKHITGRIWEEPVNNAKDNLRKNVLKNPAISKEKAIEIAVKWSASAENIQAYTPTIDEKDIKNAQLDIFVANMKNIADNEFEYAFRLTWDVLCCEKNIKIKVDAMTGKVLGIWQCHTVPEAPFNKDAIK